MSSQQSMWELRKELTPMFGLTAAIVLTQIVFWSSPGKNGAPKLRVRWRGRLLLAKSRRELGSEVGLTERQVKAALDKLRRAGVITTEQHLFGQGKNVNHIWLDTARLAHLLSQDRTSARLAIGGPPERPGTGHSDRAQASKPGGRISTARVDSDGPPGRAISVRSFHTDTTSDITTEITAGTTTVALRAEAAGETSISSERGERELDPTSSEEEDPTSAPAYPTPNKSLAEQIASSELVEDFAPLADLPPLPEWDDCEQLRDNDGADAMRADADQERPAEVRP